MTRREALLLGGAVSAPTVMGVLAGCERVADGAGVLSADHRETVAALAEIGRAWAV